MTALDEALSRMGQYNGSVYNAATNPYGYSGVGGMDANWVPTLRDVALATTSIVTLAAAASGSAGAAATSATTAGNHAGDANTAKVAAQTAQGLSEQARDKAQAWSEGTSPGGPGTKSAREHAADAAASAASISGGPVASVDGATGVVVTASASETVAGRIEIATQAEVTAGADNVRAVTPLKLAAWPSALGSVAPATGDKILLADVSAGGVPKTASLSDILALAGSSLVRSARTANTTLGVADKGALIDMAGTWTQTLVAAATLGTGWFCYIANSGGGVITLDPNASETIDGRVAINVYPGENFIVQCDGSAFRTVGRVRSGGLILLNDTIVSSSVSSVDFTAGFTDTELYSLELELNDVYGGGSVAHPWAFRMYINSAWISSGYWSHSNISTADGATYSGVSGNSTAGIGLSGASGIVVSAGSRLMGRAILSGYASINGSVGKSLKFDGYVGGDGSTNTRHFAIVGSSAGNNAACTGLRFLDVSAMATIDGGRFRLYGRRI